MANLVSKIKSISMKDKELLMAKIVINKLEDAVILIIIVLKVPVYNISF
jgi:hypothetical protein